MYRVLYKGFNGNFSMSDEMSLDKARAGRIRLTAQSKISERTRLDRTTEQQQIAFLEYFFRGGKSGLVCYFNKPDWNIHVPDEAYNEYVCVDGLQRITACLRFVNNEIPIFGCYYKDFEDKPRMKHTLRLNVNNLKTEKEVLQWYIDMNVGGTPHTLEEIERVKKMIEELE